MIGKEVKKKLKEAVWETGRWGNKVFGKELSKKITEAVLETGRVGNTIKKELEKGLKEAKKEFEKIGKELEKQITNSNLAYIPRQQDQQADQCSRRTCGSCPR